MTTLTQILSTQSGKENTANENFSSVSPAGFLGRRAVAHLLLDWAYYGGVVWANGGWRIIADGVVACTASQTNYIGLDLEGDGTDPAITKNTTGFVDGEIPLYEVGCDATDITGETDRRVGIDLAPQQGHDVQTIAWATPITPDALAGEVVDLGAIAAALTVNAPTNPFLGARLTFLFLQNGTGNFAITWNAAFKKSTDPTAGSPNQQGTISFIYDGANWVQTGGALIWF